VKRDRLTRLRAWTEASAGTELPFVYSDGVLRVLLERQELLDAAKGALAVLDRLDHSIMEVRNGLAAAVARAEAP
jgi:hypothetical protein